MRARCAVSRPGSCRSGRRARRDREGADDVRFEIETFTAESWLGFWTALGAPRRAIAAGRPPFQQRFATATCALPPELPAAAAKLHYAAVRAAARAAGVSIVEVSDDAARPLPRPASPWRARPLSWPPGSAGDLAAVPAGSRAPLGGIRVAEATNRIQGPLAGHLLGLLGAEVVRLEPPGGDPMRGVPPLTGGCSVRFLALNRGKGVIEADLKTPAGRETARGLLAASDVFLQNWPPGRARLFAMDADDLAAVRPGLVYTHAGGWAEAHPAPQPMGTDYLVQAYTGVAALLAGRGRPPAPTLMTITDVLGALIGAEGTIAGLLARARTGTGVRVETGLVDAACLLRDAHADRPAADVPPTAPVVADLAEMAAAPAYAALFETRGGVAFTRSPPTRREAPWHPPSAGHRPTASPWSTMSPPRSAGHGPPPGAAPAGTCTRCSATTSAPSPGVPPSSTTRASSPTPRSTTASAGRPPRCGPPAGGPPTSSPCCCRTDATPSSPSRRSRRSAPWPCDPPHARTARHRTPPRPLPRRRPHHRPGGARVSGGHGRPSAVDARPGPAPRSPLPRRRRSAGLESRARRRGCPGPHPDLLGIGIRTQDGGLLPQRHGRRPRQLRGRPEIRVRADAGPRAGLAGLGVRVARNLGDRRAPRRHAGPAAALRRRGRARRDRTAPPHPPVRRSDHAVAHGRMRERRGRVVAQGVISSTGPVHEHVRDACVRRFGIPPVNIYGSSDGVNCRTARDPGRWAPGPAGVPDPDVAEISIRDAEGRPLPPGRAGEIWALGPMTPLCYVASPDLDARYRAPGGWVRTGDLGRLDDDGTLWVLDRIKRVINRGGVKICPAEVERVLADHPDIADVHCVPVHDRDLGERMCACLAPRPGAVPPSPAALIDCLLERGVDRRGLPERFLTLPELPLGPTGKVSVAALTRLAAEAAVPVDAAGPARRPNARM